jgi:hypothetical protein
MRWGGAVARWVTAVARSTATEVTLTAAPSTQDFYDVSLVDGNNIPIAMAPYHVKGAKCIPTGCISDLNRLCLATN